MRRVLLVVGVAVLAIAAVAAIGVGIAAYRGPTFDKEAKVFLDEAAQAILASRDKQQLLDRATPELRANAKPQQIAAIFDALAQLGPLVEYDGVTGDATLDLSFAKGFTVSAVGDAKARCRHGNVILHMITVRRDGRWMIDELSFKTKPVENAVKTSE